MVQNHLIQLVALTAMEPPAIFNADNFRNEVVKVYESLTPLNEEDLNEHIAVSYTHLSLSCSPCAIRAAAREILRVTKVSPRRSLSWLNRIPFTANIP